MRISKGNLSIRCRIGRSRVFSIVDRVRFLLNGRLWVITVNGKAHTEVMLALRQPTDEERRVAQESARRG